MNILQGLASTASVIVELILFIITIYYLTKSRTLDSKLLFAGSLLGLIVRVCYPVLAWVISSSFDNSSILLSYYAVLSSMGVISSALYCFGFGLLIQRITKKTA